MSKRSKKKDRLFTETYRIDESTHLYMIEIVLAHYSEIFNEWDPAPFNRREVAPSLESYLKRSFEEIPSQYPFELCFTITDETRDEKIEEEARNGLKNNFTFKIYLLKKELKKINIRMLCFALIGFFLLGMATIFPDNPNIVLPSIFAQALLIGGWVFLWEAFSVLVFKNRELYDHYQIYKSLRNAPVIFRDKENRDYASGF